MKYNCEQTDEGEGSRVEGHEKEAEPEEEVEEEGEKKVEKADKGCQVKMKKVFGLERKYDLCGDLLVLGYKKATQLYEEGKISYEKYYRKVMPSYWPFLQ